MHIRRPKTEPLGRRLGSPRLRNRHFSHRLLPALIPALLCLLPVIASAQTTIHIPADQPTIQAGIDAASSGDTVLVSPGTYYENIDFKGKAITVTSSGGAAVTTINGPNRTATVVFQSGESRNSVLSNFTITGGGTGYLANPTGAIFINASSPTVLNSTFTMANCYGFFSLYSSPLIQGNDINNVQDKTGACGIGGGSGILLYGQRGSVSAVVLGNIIENNTDSGIEDGPNGGGGLDIWEGTPIIANNIIRNNWTGKNPSVAGGGYGGGIFFEVGSGLVINNLIYGNKSNLGGGGIFIIDATTPNPPQPTSPLTLINNTIVDNAVVPVTTYSQTVIGGEQIYYEGSTHIVGGVDVILTNNIISGRTAAPSVVCNDNGGSRVSYSHNNFYNAAGPVTVGGSFFTIIANPNCNFPVGANGNISVDVSFASQASQDYHLIASSPGVDAGNNSAIQASISYGYPDALDLDNNPRIQRSGSGCVIDIGAYEYLGFGCNVLETLTSSLNPATVGQNVTFTAQLSSTNGTPTGTVQFLDGVNLLSTQPVSGAGTVAFSTSALTVGVHNISANYQPTGTFSPNTASLTQVVNGYATGTTLTCQPNPISAFGTALITVTVTSTNGTPSGSITFTDGGATLATQSLLNGATTLTYTGQIAQTHSIIATYIPTGAFAASSASCSEVVKALPTMSALTVSPSALYASPVALTAVVSSSTSSAPNAPTGTVTFYDAATAIGTAQLDTSGHAVLTMTTLTSGTHTLTAVYAGNSIYASSTSSPFTEVIQAPPTPDFSITLATPTISIETQHHKTTALTLTSLNGFSGPLTIICSNLPEYLTCLPTPVTQSLAPGASATVSLYLDTDSVLQYARNSSAPRPGHFSSPATWATFFAPLTLFGYIRRRKGKQTFRLVMFLLCLLPLCLAITGCSEYVSTQIPPSVAPGTYPLSITATSTSTGLSHTTQLTLQVTP